MMRGNARGAAIDGAAYHANERLCDRRALAPFGKRHLCAANVRQTLLAALKERLLVAANDFDGAPASPADAEIK